MIPRFARPIALQGAAVILALSLAWPYYGLKGEALPWLVTCLTIGGIALLLSLLMQDRWPVRLLHGMLMPTIWLVHELAVEWILLLIPFLSLLLYRFALAKQEPLTPVDQQAIEALYELLYERAGGRVVALGNNISSFFAPLIQALPDHQFTLIEQNRSQALIQRVLNLGRTNLLWLNAPTLPKLTDKDALYVMLDPHGLGQFVEQARQALAINTLLISRNHALPGLVPMRIIELDADDRQTLYCYLPRQ